eukprot:122987-Chlamydomonas_euryale.AAC.7
MPCRPPEEQHVGPTQRCQPSASAIVLGCRACARATATCHAHTCTLNVCQALARAPRAMKSQGYAPPSPVLPPFPPPLLGTSAC